VSFTLVAPRTPKEACRLLAAAPAGSAIALAGGTDVLLDVDDGRLTPHQLVSLRRLPWRSIRWRGDSVTIGSMAPLSEIEADPGIHSRLPGLWMAVRAVGSLALRHRATLGGNLGRASPASDLIPILLALDARVGVVGPLGSRTISVDELIEGSRAVTLTPGELIQSVTIPHGTPCAYEWQRVRPSNDISQVGVAVAAPSGGGGWRLALGGVWPRPCRLPDAEHRLVSRRPSEVETELAAQEASTRAPFVTDKRATEAYRRRLVRTLTRRAIARTLEISVDPPSYRASRRPL